jgi:hypothetical protein
MSPLRGWVISPFMTCHTKKYFVRGAFLIFSKKIKKAPLTLFYFAAGGGEIVTKI